MSAAFVMRSQVYWGAGEINVPRQSATTTAAACFWREAANRVAATSCAPDAELPLTSF
jgi:hypothetical protein